MRQVARHAGLAGSAVRQVACDITSVAELQVETRRAVQNSQQGFGKYGASSGQG